ncbi:MAG: sigma-70 family RNA polymerase sigma factor [Melioribacteraceae bacterium]|nr:sigma-70 family RNA polymerase sigma factor [Melioribacteraceae bacterium]
MKKNTEVTQMLLRVSEGNKEAVNSLFPVVYSELQKMAQNQLKHERKGHTINATSLVHEAYFKLVDQKYVTWQNRAHFFGIACQAMRRILINYANSKSAYKRGSGIPEITLIDNVEEKVINTEDLIDLDTALNRLEKISERQSKIIEYWFFVGLTHEEISEVIGTSLPTVRRDWRLARAWLSRELKNKII